MTEVIESLPKTSTAGRQGWKNKIPWLAASIVLAAPQSVFACAACTGRSDDAAAQGLNAAVFTLLLVLLTVYGAFAGCLTYLIHRAAKHPLMPPDVQERPIASPHRARSFAITSRATINRVIDILSGLNRQTILKSRKEWYENGRN